MTKKKTPRVAYLAAIMAALVLIAACGGEPEETPAAAETPAGDVGTATPVPTLTPRAAVTPPPAPTAEAPAPRPAPSPAPTPVVPTPSPQVSRPGELEMRVTDAPPEGVTKILVTVSGI